MSLLDCKKALETLGLPLGDKAVIIGGGGKSPLWRQITADVLGMTLSEKRYADSSFGSAMLAGIQMGIWKDPKDALAACNADQSVTHPNAENHEQYAKVFERYKAVHDALAPIYHAK